MGDALPTVKLFSDLLQGAQGFRGVVTDAVHAGATLALSSKSSRGMSMGALDERGRGERMP
jgi:hypothetical protein